MKDEFTRALYAEVGNGGIKCPCCKPAGRKSKKRHRRRARARMKARHRKEVRGFVT